MKRSYVIMCLSLAGFAFVSCGPLLNQVLAVGPYFVDPTTEFGVCTNSAQQSTPVISDNMVVWKDGRNGRSSDIYGKNLSTGVEFPVCTNPVGWRTEPSVSGNIAVWADYRNGNYDIYGKNLSTGVEFDVCMNSSAQNAPAIDGSTIVWHDWRSGLQIYGKKLGENEFPVSTSGSGLTPDISGDIVVWYSSGSGGNPTQGIYAKNLTGGTQFPVCTHSGIQTKPVVSDQLVVWEDYRRGSYSSEYGDIYAKDLSTGSEIPIQTRGFASSPAVSGDIVVWADDRGLYGYDIRTHSEFQICDSTYRPGSPKISGNTVVWDTTRHKEDILGNFLSYVDPSVVVSANQTRVNSAAPGAHSSPTISFQMHQTAQSFVESVVIDHGDGSSDSVPFTQASSLTFSTTASHGFTLPADQDAKTFAVTGTAYGPSDNSSDNDQSTDSVNVTLFRSPLAVLNLDDALVAPGSVVEVISGQTFFFDGSPAFGFIEEASLMLGVQEIMAAISPSGIADEGFEGELMIPELPLGSDILLEYTTSNTGAGLNSNSWSATLHVVPEPTMLAFLALGGGLLIRRRR